MSILSYDDKECDRVSSGDDESGGQLAPARVGRGEGNARAASSNRSLSSYGRPLLKAVGILACTLGLAAVGQFSMKHSANPDQPGGELLAGLGRNEWLAPNPTGNSRRAKASTAEHSKPSARAPASADPGGQAAPLASPCPEPEKQGNAAATGITPDNKVILNLASAEELTRLPGIGQKRAEAIIELRDRLKRFKRPTDLLRIRGIGPKSLRRMLPHLVLDAPEPAAPKPDGKDQGGKSETKPAPSGSIDGSRRAPPGSS